MKNRSWWMSSPVCVFVLACGGAQGDQERPSVERAPAQTDDTEGAPVQAPSPLDAEPEYLSIEQSSACSDADATPLRETGRRVGVALSARLLSDPEYAEVAAREFNLVTPENEMKWDATEPSPGNFRFDAADGIARFAQEHGMELRGHTLVWHSQLPRWVEALEGADTVREAMTNHIEGVVAHYRENFPGLVTSWDVVNEALESIDGVARYRDSVFHRELGEGFIAEAFEITRRADPDALLFYNDFGIESLGAKSQATYEMVRDLVEAGVPIDGVGFQMHTLAWDRGPEREHFERNIERYHELGLLVNISEMDVTVCRGDAFESLDHALSVQRERYNQIIGTCLANPACESIALWGVADPHSWLNSHMPCESPDWQPWPLAFDAEYRKKPAWWGVYDALTDCNPWRE